MRRHRQPLICILAALAAGLAGALGGCSSAPRSATSPAAPTAGPVAIDYVAHRYIDESAFRRISEYLTGGENKSGRIIERTDPKERSGYYFIVDLDWHPGVTLPAGTRAELEYVRGDIPTPQKKEFVFSSATGTWPEIFLGLTGADWPRKDIALVAYKITLKDAGGQILAQRQSFLWGLPESPAPTVAATAPAKANP